MIDATFTNFPDCKLYTWVRVISFTHIFLEMLEQLCFTIFQNSCLKYLTRSIFECFCKTPHLSSSTCFSLLRRCLRFIARLFKVYSTFYIVKQTILVIKFLTSYLNVSLKLKYRPSNKS